MSLFAADDVHLWRGDAHVLRGVSFSLSAGECLRVTGANGSGKTTLLRALCALLPLDAGSVRWRGESIAADPGSLHRELAWLGHDNGLKGDLSAAENLRFGVGLCRRVSGGAIEAALARVGLPARGQGRMPLRRCSAGQRRRAALARLTLMDAALWVLDEPGSNLDAAGQVLLRELLQDHLEAGGLAVVATHQDLGLPAAVQRPLGLS